MTRKERIITALTELNNNYGRGEIKKAVVKSGVLTRKIVCNQNGNGFKETRRFRIKGSTVYFLGHQRKIA